MAAMVGDEHPDLRRLPKLEAIRQPNESLWYDAAVYCLPRKARTNRDSRVDGEYLNEYVFDGTPEAAADIASAAMHGILTPHNTQWFEIDVEADEKVKTRDDVANWLYASNKRFYAYVYDNEAGFATQVDELYIDAIVFGLYSMLVDDMPLTSDLPFRFDTRSHEELIISENQHGHVDTIFRPVKYTADQAVQKFGGMPRARLDSTITETAKNSPDKELEFLHVMMPRHNRNKDMRDSMNMPVASRWFDMQRKELIVESGFDEQALMVGRWRRRAGTIYPDSMSIGALQDIRMLQSMAETNLAAGERMANPPLFARGLQGRLDTTAGVVNYSQDRNPNTGIDQLYNVAGLSFPLEMQNDVRNIIRNRFYLDRFEFSDDLPEMTATEVIERRNRQMLKREPMLARFYSDVFNGVLIRAFMIMLRRGMFGPVPEPIAGTKLKVKYESPFIQAQRLQEAQGVLGLHGVVTQFAATHPDVTDRFDADAAVDVFGEAYNSPPKVIRDMDATKALRQKRAEEQQMLQQAALAEGAADSMAKLTKAGAV